jgi:hypothetical protein
MPFFCSSTKYLQGLKTGLEGNLIWNSYHIKSWSLINFFHADIVDSESRLE